MILGQILGAKNHADFMYLLLYYLPKSTSIYIGKHYEIIGLIVILMIFLLFFTCRSFIVFIFFLHFDKFNNVIRNSGFIFTTILIKLSFNTEGILNTVLIVTAVAFGVLI